MPVNQHVSSRKLGGGGGILQGKRAYFKQIGTLKSYSCPLLTKWRAAIPPFPQHHQHHQHQWGGMFLTLSQAAAAVKATRSSALLDAQRRHQAAWSGATHLPPGGGQAARHGQGWYLRSGPLLLEGYTGRVWAGSRSADLGLGLGSTAVVRVGRRRQLSPEGR